MRATSSEKAERASDDQSASAPRMRRYVRVLVILLVLALLLGFCITYAFLIEPHWLKIKRITLTDDATVRLIHITDVHYKGDREYLEKVVKVINDTEADFVCFTGDLVEELDYLPECLGILSRVGKPVYGVPGNHDHTARVSAADMRTACRQTGGDWLSDTSVLVSGGGSRACRECRHRKSDFAGPVGPRCEADSVDT